MLGQGLAEPVSADCDPELDWLPMEVDVVAVVVLAAAKASPTEDIAASTEMASIE